LLLSRTLYAFGQNVFGELGSSTNNGMGTANPTPTPVTLPGEIGPVTQVAAGSDHSLAVTASGPVYAFGSNEFGQLGTATNDGTVNPNPTPTLVRLASGTTIDTVAKGDGANHSLAIVSDLAIITSALPAAQAGSSYREALTATGGTTPLTWSQTGLPSGLSIDPRSGVLAGTPTSAGSSRVTTTATDSYGNQTSRAYTLTIKATGPPKCGASQTAGPGCHTPLLLTNVHESHHKTNRDRPRCARTQTIGTLTASGHAGRNQLPFKGRIARARKLRPGTYTVVIAAHASGSISRPRTLTFTILPG
jgi:hypothetical protein